jgi:arylsulfatase A-like enzyme
MDSRNILFIVADQFRADLLFDEGAGGLADAVDLPNLRALMAESASFRNHWTVITPCGPARASLLTGQYAMNHRSVRNGTPLDRNIPTIPSEMRKAGYTPMLFGYSDTSADPRGRDPRDPAVRNYEMPMDGFDEKLEMRLEQSHPWRGHLAMRGYDLPDYSDFYVPDGPDPDSPAFYGRDDSDTAFLTDECLKTLAGMPERGWFAHLTFIRPHPPFVAPAPYNRMFRDRDIPPADLIGADVAEHPLVAGARAYIPLHRTLRGFPDLPDTPENVALIRQVYLGLAAEVDHHVGRMIGFLKDSGQYDDTLIVFCSDHGEMLGDHGSWGKSTVFDAAFRIPMIIRDPGGRGAGRVVDAPTESIDLFPTLLDFAGLAHPTSLDGRSLWSLIDGEAPDDWRDHSWSELDFGTTSVPGGVDGMLSRDQRNLSILREADLTLVHFNGGLPPLLFDHRAAGEARNVAGDPAYAGDLLRLTQRTLDHRMTNADRTLTRYKITPDGPKRV